MPDRVDDGGALEAAMDHAVLALLVLADAVLVPLGVFHQLLEGLHVTFAEQIAGLLPAEDAAQRHRPRRALVSLVAREEVEEQRGLGELPVLAAIAARKDVAEQLLGAVAVEEAVLVRRALIGIAGRDGDAVQPRSEEHTSEL